MRKSGTITITLKYKLRKIMDIYDQDYSEQELSDYINENLETELESIDLSVKKVKID